MQSELPEFRDWSLAAVRLFQGAIEAEDARLWNLLLTNRSQLETYFGRVGLRVVIDETEGFAYLRQLSGEESPAGYNTLPKLFRTKRFSFGQTVLCVLLRDALRRFEEEQTLNERCVVEESDLFDEWKAFFPNQGDDVKLRRELHAGLRKLEDAGLVRRFGEERGQWEVRRILKARLNAEELEHLHRSLAAAVAQQESTETVTAPEP